MENSKNQCEKEEKEKRRQVGGWVGSVPLGG